MAMAKSAGVEVEAIPEWRVRTPLQRAVQILKRHRDIFFVDDQDARPISVITTTLAAQAYSGQADVFLAIAEVVAAMEANWGKPGFVENRNGKWWVANPTDKDENFADKWNEHPERRTAFREWLHRAAQDVAGISGFQRATEATDFLKKSLGSDVMARVASEFDGPVYRKLTRPAIDQGTQGLGVASHCLPPKWPVQRSYSVQVTGTVHNSRWGPKKWDFSDRQQPKWVHFWFKATTNAPQPYEVFWQVVNTGREAEEAGDLRGDFYPCDDGTRTGRWEHSKYSGSHWVEAFVVRDGVCVARSGRHFVRIRPD